MAQNEQLYQISPNGPLYHLVRHAQSGAHAVNAELIAQFMPLLRKAANKYRRISYEDALQEASLAFLEELRSTIMSSEFRSPGTSRLSVGRSSDRHAAVVAYRLACGWRSRANSIPGMSFPSSARQQRDVIQDVVTLFWLDGAGLSH